MRRVQRSRIKWWHIVLIVVVLLASVNVGGNYIISENNYTHNLEVVELFSVGNFDSQDYLNNVNALSAFNYSLKQDVNAYTHILATYNTLNYLKRAGLYEGTVDKYLFPEIIKYYDLYAQLGFGYLGTNPIAISWYFKSLGFKAEISFNRQDFSDKLVNSTIGILYRKGKTTSGAEDIEYRTIIKEPEINRARYLGPSQTFDIRTRITYDTAEYKDYFLALITINI